MDHKPWRWRRKASEKTKDINGRSSLSLERNFEQQDRDNDSESLRCPSNLSDRLPSVICDCSVKEELIRKHRRIAEQALAGQEMERAEATYLKEELEKALQQGEMAEKKLAHLNAALKDCTREIESLKEQQDERVQNAFSKAKLDCEKERTKLEGKLTEASRRISNLSSENANLMKALICKERLLHDLDNGKAELESELGILTDRLESTEKENTHLKYEIWNEEKKSGRIFALEHAKQISKLEAECQQLRHLVRKRLQVDVQGTDQASMMKKRLNPTVSEKPDKGTRYLIEKVYTLEEENTTLRDILALSDRELQSWRIKYGQMGSRLAELEAQLLELSGGENSMQLAISSLVHNQNDGYDDSETWAGALLAELEQFRQGKLENQQDYKAIVSSTELVPIFEDNAAHIRQHSSWLDEILKVILEEHQVSNRNLGELLQDIEIALGQNGSYISKTEAESCSEICGLLTWDALEPISMEDTKAPRIKDASFTKEKIRKRLSFDRSKSDIGLELDSPNRHNTLAQMIRIQSTLQDENKRMKEKLQKVTEEKVALRTEVRESKQIIESLQKELESFKESKGLIEDQIENQRLINEDLNTQLTVAKSKLNEILHKLSSLEVELDHRNNCCDELESTCLELQLQLETVSRKESPDTYIDAVAKQLFDQAICPVPAKKSLNVQGYSLRDRLLEEECEEKDGQKCFQTEEKSSDENPKTSIVVHTGNKPLPASEQKASSPEQAVTLAVVSSKTTSRGFGFIRKLFFRRKKACAKMKPMTLQRNTSALMKQRAVLLVV